MKFNLDKSLKYLWLINGLVILGAMTNSMIIQPLLNPKPEPHYYYEHGDDDIVIGEKLAKAIEEGRILQGLTYAMPSSINNSSNYYMLISAHTYEEAKEYERAAGSAGDLSFSFYNCVNILFLDKNYQPTRSLLDKKASILDFEFPRYYKADSDTFSKHIAYMIGFEDTNEDGVLNSDDSHDLYISDLDGSNLKQITTNLNIEEYDFQRRHNEIFISFTDRGPGREEYKNEKYAVYYLETQELEFLGGIDSAVVSLENRLITK